MGGYKKVKKSKQREGDKPLWFYLTVHRFFFGLD